MIEVALEWVAHQWLEIGTLVATCGALFYAHLAYRTSKRGLDQAKQAEVNSLRIQAKAALNDTRQAQVSLELSCQVYRANWASYARTQPILGRPAGHFERCPINAVQSEGRQLLAPLSTSSENVDKMDLSELEALMQRAKATSLRIQALAGKLEPPP